MCYTVKDSLLGYIINSISSILLYNISTDAQYKVMSLFLLFVGQMQLFDFGFWLNQTCGLPNKILTKLAILFNHFQPVILFLLQLAYGFRQSTISLTIFILYLFMGLFYNTEAISKIDCTLPIKGIMNWKWNHLFGGQIFYGLFISYLFAASFNFKNTIFQIVSALATILTFFVAHKTPVLNISVGRIWCYYAALMPLLFIGLYYSRLN